MRQDRFNESAAELYLRAAAKARADAAFWNRRAARKEELLRRKAPHEDFLTLLKDELREDAALTGQPAFDPLPAPACAGVYAIQAGRHVKIGKSVNIADRLSTLQTAHPEPLHFLGMLSPEPEEERWFHRKLGKYRAHGEWFRLEGEVIETIRQVRGDW